MGTPTATACPETADEQKTVAALAAFLAQIGGRL